MVFLPFRCRWSRRPYLIRYRLLEEHDVYEPLRTHRVDEEYLGAGGNQAAPTLSSREVLGVLACPYCQAEGAGRCPCGQLMCADDELGPVTCPWCGRTLQLFEGGRPFSLPARTG